MSQQWTNMEDAPQLSYVAQTATNTAGSQWQLGNVTFGAPPQQNVLQDVKFVETLQKLGNVWTTPKPDPAVKEERTMKLIRYTVVDKDPHLHAVAPENVIVMVGTQMIADERGFLLDLAADLKTALDQHNLGLADLRWEDSKGERREFKPRKPRDLDVVVEVLREYPAA